MNEENISEEFYGLLAQLVNRKNNRKVLDSIRGEYGVLRYLMYVKDGVSAGLLTKELHVVPGRMTDILKSLEKKGSIVRTRDERDRRCVYVHITEKGRVEEKKKRESIQKQYKGMYEILGKKDIEELIHLIKIVLAYSDDEE